MPARTDLCPCCERDRIGEGRSDTPEYSDGLWIGCTACGFSVSGPDAIAICAAWTSLCRSTTLRNLRQ